MKRIKGLIGLLGKGPIVGPLLLVIAAALFAYAASVPLIWEPDPKTIVTTLDPEIVVELVALVVAVLALGSTAAYFLLRSEVLRELRERIHNEMEVPLQITNASIFSYSFYQEYTKTWADSDYDRAVTLRPRFQSALHNALLSSRSAFNLSESLPSGATYDRYRRITRTELAYHLATWFLVGPSPNETARSEAVKLAQQLSNYPSLGNEAIETMAWVALVCHKPGSPQFQSGQQTIESLLVRDDIPRHWRQLVWRKYIGLFPDNFQAKEP